jgi:adenylate cyclase
VDTGGARSVGPGDLTRAILGEEPALLRDQVVEDTGLTPDEARRLWRAMGFPDVGESPAFTSADRDALRALRDLVDDTPVDFETAVQLIRAVAYTMSRLAEWQVSTLSRHVQYLESSGAGSGSRIVTAANLLDSVEKRFEDLMLYVWRRHLSAAVLRVEALGARDADLHTVPLTVGFADLVSFTRLSAGIGEERVAELAEEFEAQCSDLIAAAGGRVIKTLGDSVLFVADTPRGGLEMALDLIQQIGEAPDLPDLHIGLSTGPVAMRLGDVFGDPVNLASRLTAVARRNRVICDQATADGVRDDARFQVRNLTARVLRGVGLVSPVAVTRTTGPATQP